MLLRERFDRCTEIAALEVEQPAIAGFRDPFLKLTNYTAGRGTRTIRAKQISEKTARQICAVGSFIFCSLTDNLTNVRRAPTRNHSCRYQFLLRARSISSAR